MDAAAPLPAAVQLCACGIAASSPAPRCRACPQAMASPATPLAFVPAAAQAAFAPQAAPVAFGSAVSGPFGQPAEAPLAVRPTTSAPSYPPLMTYSRWRKGPDTFGPAGRLVASVLLLVPLPILLMAISVGIGIIGAGLYVLIVMPWALRDIWKKAAIPIEAPPQPRRL